MGLVKSKVAPAFWYSEGDKYYFTIDLTHWGFAIQFGASWYIRFLCFSWGRQ